MFKTKNQRIEIIKNNEESRVLQLFYKFVYIANNIQLSACVVFIYAFIKWVMEEKTYAYIWGDIYTMVRLAELLRMLLLGSGGWYIVRILLGKIIHKKNPAISE